MKDDYVLAIIKKFHSIRILVVMLLCFGSNRDGFGAALPTVPNPIPIGAGLEEWEGDTTNVWRVVDDAIVGGSLEGNPHNEFLATRKSYKNFVLKLEYRLRGTEGFVNGGVQFRSQRMTNPSYEMIGFQADIGAGFSGCLYDESRRKKTLAVADKLLVEAIEKPGEWNEYEIRCEGPRILIKLNGKVTVDYTEREPGVPDRGVVALQIHGDSKAEIAFRRITISELPDDLVPTDAEILGRFSDSVGTKQAARPASFANGAFELGANEVVVFAGQANLVRDQRTAALESRLLLAFLDRTLRFRSMAWEGDTVYDQWREVNFGTWQDQLAAVGATTVFLQYGQLEALDGPTRLAEFANAYGAMMDRFAGQTPRLVVLSPIPFERPIATHAPDLSKRNADLGAYVEAIRKLARERGAIFVDLFSPLLARSSSQASRLTDDGLHLTAAGQETVADLVMEKLGIRGVYRMKAVVPLRATIAEKNRLFASTWRPANWTFAYGDRVTYPFGKGSGGAPDLHQALGQFKPLITEQETRIYQMARGGAAEPGPVVASDSSEKNPPAEFSPEEELASMTVADGYEVTLFASERDGVVKPTQISWDEHGRMLVACSPTYPQLRPGQKPSDYILVLEDAEKLGRATRSWKFAEGLTMVQGVEPGDGGVYACDYNQLVHFADTDGDGRADQRRVVLDGFGDGDTHQLINSVCHGPDGSLWFSQGLHVYSRVETPWGVVRLEKAGLWRFRPKTLQLERFFNGGRAGYNCWGVAFDNFGQAFHKSGDRPEGYYSGPGLVRADTWDEYHEVGALFQTSPKTTSLDFIGTQALPATVQGAAVIAGYFGNVVEMHRLMDDGAGFKSEQLPKLLTSTSTSFRPVDVSVGPDGAIYVADWFNPVIGHYQASYADPTRDKSHGRIWRIAAKGRAAIKIPALAPMSPAELLQQLRSPERWIRTQAKRLLFDAPESAVLQAADDWVKLLNPAAPGYEALLMEVIGVYEAHEAPRPELLHKLLSADDARVRAYGVQVIGRWAGRLPDALPLLRRCLVDPNPRVRLEAIVACSYVDEPSAVEVVTMALDAPRDRFIDYALTQCVRAMGTRWPALVTGDHFKYGGRVDHAAFVRSIVGAAVTSISPGQAVYESLCLNCHQPQGRGLPGVYPPLAGSDVVSGDATALIKILLHGLEGPVTVKGQEYGRQPPIPMPATGLDDEQIAAVLTYVRGEFGNSSGGVTSAEVREVRKRTSTRTTPWTAAELRP